MRRRLVVPLAVLLVLAAGTPAAAQGAVPQAPVPAPAPPAATPQANICTTQHGWCPLQIIVLPGAPCYCLAPPATWLPGVARYWPYTGPVSPYLNPHVAPPSTIR